MRRFPLFSEAYEAALFSSDHLPCERDEDQAVSECRPWTPRGEAPCDVFEDDKDMETARTRPLRLDQLHL